MDPFTIHCSSCQSRIRVRNPSMIGQIANCPKCGSMIMITAPQPSLAAPQQILVDSPTGSVTDSVAVTKEALPVPEESLLGEMHPLEQGFDQAFRSEGLPGIATPEPDAFESLSPTNWMPEPTPPPRADEVVPTAAPPSNSRQLMLVAAIGLCSVLVACGVFFIFLRWYAGPSTVAANPTAPDSPAALSPDIAPALAVTAGAAEPGAAAALSETTPAAENPPADPSTADPSTADPSTADPSTADPSTADPSTAQLAEPPSLELDQDLANPAITTPDNAAAAAAPHTAASESSEQVASGAPLASVGSGTLDSGNAPSGAPLGSQLMPDIDATFEAAGGVEGDQPLKETLPPGLQSFASIFDQSLVPVLSDATVPLAAAPDAGEDQTTTDEVTPAASPMTLMLPETLEQKQATTISGLLIQARPLAQVLSTLSLMSDIPFTADLDGLLAAGVDRNQVVDFKSATPVTVVEVLAALTRDYGLNFEPYEKKLFIVRGSASSVQSRIPAGLPIGDLVDGADQTAALSAALNELLPELADGFQLADGAAQADLEKVNRLLWFQVARLLETWRAARSIENAESAALVPKSSQLPAWPVDGAQKLAQTLMPPTRLPEPLAYGWQRLAGGAGMTCWVDWPSLLGAEVSPSRIGMTLSHGRPLQELLQHDADKYEIVFALENERTLWVTSAEMHRFQPRLYVLPMAGKTVDQWRTELEPLTPLNPDGSEALKVVASPDGQFVFIRCCRPLLAAPQL